MEKGAGEGMLRRRDGKLESQNGDGKEFNKGWGWRATSDHPIAWDGFVSFPPSTPEIR